MPERIDGHVHFRVVAPFVTIVASTRTILTASASKTAGLGCPPGILAPRELRSEGRWPLPQKQDDWALPTLAIDV